MHVRGWSMPCHCGCVSRAKASVANHNRNTCTGIITPLMEEGKNLKNCNRLQMFNRTVTYCRNTVLYMLTQPNLTLHCEFPSPLLCVFVSRWTFHCQAAGANTEITLLLKSQAWKSQSYPTVPRGGSAASKVYCTHPCLKGRFENKINIIHT